MKIAILNECFFGEKHLIKLKQLGDLVIYNDTDSEDNAIKRLKDVDICIADCFIAPLNKRVLGSAQKLKLLALNSTGYDVVDLKTAIEKGIKVANTPGFSTEAVAEHAIALMFAVIKRIPMGDKGVREKPFEVDPANKSHREYIGFNILGKTLGVIGMGNIGSRVAELGMCLGMKVIVYNRTIKKIKGVKVVKLDELLKQSDVVSIHLALSPETENIISKKELRLMKPSAIIINTARGKHINTNDLFEAL